VNQLLLIVYKINQDTITGICNVVCTSKDSRNPQPSDEELRAADFIFYRAIDIRRCKILDKIGDKVAGIEGITFSLFLCLLFIYLFFHLIT
jgi:hypothetical protein